jgi:hypothetical protein
MKQSGLSLVEYVIYIGIAAVVLIAMVSYAWILIDDQTKIERLAEVNDVGIYVFEEIVYETERANVIGVSTVYGTNPGKLVLSFSTGPSITFATYQTTVYVGATPVTITKLTRQEGTGLPVDITADNVNVTNFVITDLSKTNATTISIDLTVASLNPEDNKTYEAENSWTTSVTLRAH